MITFKQFLVEASASDDLMDIDFFAKLINAAVKRAPLKLHIFYDGALHTGIITHASPHNPPGTLQVWYNVGNDQRVLFIYGEDLHRFHIGKNEIGDKALLITEGRTIYAKVIDDAPTWSPSHAEDSYRIGNITFSAADGLGSVPDNTSVWYKGFVASMTPSTFLSLALDDDGHQEPTSRNLETLVKQGYAVGIPFLVIRFDRTGNELPRITGHEGRGRMRMVRRVLGDIPIPVHFFLADGLRSRNLTRDMIDEVKQGLFAERSDKIVRNPVSSVWIDKKAA